MTEQQRAEYPWLFAFVFSIFGEPSWQATWQRSSTPAMHAACPVGFLPQLSELRVRCSRCRFELHSQAPDDRAATTSLQASLWA